MSYLWGPAVRGQHIEEEVRGVVVPGTLIPS